MTAGTSRSRCEQVDANVDRRGGPRRERGAALALNVGAMLLAFIALRRAAERVIGWAGGLVGLGT